MVDYQLYTDGACSGNPGPGGRGVVVLIKKHLYGKIGKDKIYLSGRLNPTTNNQMELRAVIEGLKWVCTQHDISFAKNDPGGLFDAGSGKSIPSVTPTIDLYLDSLYVKHGILERIHKRRGNGRKTTGKQVVKNLELWQELDLLVSLCHINRHWVKGHDGNKYNEIADKLATGILKIKN